jgi:starch-binding outer membrane protein, SusD/RagB family
MKKIISILTFIVITSFCWMACKKDTINIKPTLPTDATYFTTEDQFNQGIIGIYSKLVFFYNYRGYSGNGWLHDVRLLPDDDLTTNTADDFEVFSTITVNNGKSSDYFGYLYELNARANNMLDIFAANADKVYTHDNIKNWHKGEMLFLRAYSHFQLWNLYGVSPVITKRIKADSLLFPPGSTGTQLLDAAITDFTAAVQLLPDTWDALNTGRATKGATLGMLGKALLYRGTVNKNQVDLTAAAQQFSQITGYSLTANYYDNFDQDKENNSESLFEIQLGRNARSEGSNPWLSTDNIDGNGDIGGYWGFFDDHWSLFGTSRFKATKSLITAFPSNDPRGYNTMDGDGNVVKYVKGTYGGESNFQATYSNNARVLRYADILLMQAEALVQSGGATTQAIELINKVRERARKSVSPVSTVPANFSTAETDRKKILKWVIEERRIELAFEEGIRWFDLRRWHMGGVLKDIYNKDLETGWDFSSVQPTTTFTKKNLYLPIPFGELQLNTNLIQNILWK